MSKEVEQMIDFVNSFKFAITEDGKPAMLRDNGECYQAKDDSMESVLAMINKAVDTF